MTQEVSVVKQALDLIATGGRDSIEAARKLLSIEPISGDRARISDLAIENKLYADLLRQSADAIGDGNVRSYIDTELANPIKERLLEFLNAQEIPGLSQKMHFLK